MAVHEGPKVKSTLVDGQLIAIPSTSEWNEILRLGEFQGIPVYSQLTEDLVRRLHNFVAVHPNNFSLGLVRPGNLKSWLAVPLLDIGALQRVQIERHVCEKCKWEGIIANPLESGLYLGVPHAFDVMKKAAQIPRVCCPRCGTEMTRPAIWLETKA